MCRRLVVHLEWQVVLPEEAAEDLDCHQLHAEQFYGVVEVPAGILPDENVEQTYSSPNRLCFLFGRSQSPSLAQ